MGKMAKIYDVSSKVDVKLSNYSEEIYLINLGYKVYAMKHGYLLDSVEVNNREYETYMRRVNQNELVHISEGKVDVYKLRINEEVNPAKMSLESRDSIEVPNFRWAMKFVGALSMLGDNLVVFYQVDSSRYPSLKG